MEGLDDEKIKKGALIMAYNAGSNVVTIKFGEDRQEVQEAKERLKEQKQQINDFLEAAESMQEATIFNNDTNDDDMKLALLTMEAITNWTPEADDELEGMMLELINRVASKFTD